MTRTEKIAKIAPYFQQLTLATLEHLVDTSNKEMALFNTENIQELIKPLLEEMDDEDHGTVMEFAALGIAKMIHEKIREDVDRIKEEIARRKDTNTND